MWFTYKTFFVIRTFDPYDNYTSIDGIFLSKEKAEKYLAEHPFYTNVTIEEYDVPTDCGTEEGV